MPHRLFIASVALSILALAACAAGTGPSYVAPSATSASQDMHGAWLRQGLQKDDLLYLAYNALNVFTYPQGKLVGGLQQPYSTRGECVDARGDVFVTNIQGEIEEYAHGHIGVIGELHTVREYPLACAIDPTTGDLAVTGGGNRINIFSGAQGNATVYKFRLFSSSSFCSFDGKGNLFLTGALGKRPVLVELPKGSRKLISIKLDTAITQDSEIQWDGQYLAVGVSKLFGAKKTQIYRFAINGTSGTLVGTTELGRPAYNMYQFLVVGKTLIVSNEYFVSSQSKSDLLFYHYPSGGAPFKVIPKARQTTFGIAVSSAQ